MAKLSIRSVSKSYGAVQVLDDVSVEVEEGSFVVLLGPSGCGKSTLLHAVAGLNPIDSGTIVIGDRNVTNLPARDRDVAMVFQSYALYPTMTVAQNIAFPLKMRGLDRRTSDEKVAGVARLLQIEPLLARLPRELSGGQRQRVAIGRALVRDPRLFLFDEPLSNLDAALRTELRAEIKRLHQSIRRTMVYVTHDQTEALTLADKIVVLKSGRIEQTGTPLSLYDDPDNAFVAGFIGTPRMNFLKAVVVDDGKALTTGEARVDISHLKTKLENGKTVTLGIRPEHLDEKQGVALPLAVDVTERLGSTSYVHGALPSGETVVAERREDQPRFGETITLHFQPTRARVFDADGNRIR
ncbi:MULTISPECIES: ABC transporter ATP-binding protein [unclassified Mesorhizobium]|uniref:ABC transporter ATP-binding protein n=1 Tax=unclassified Mesorhizobium TaxID=325217 RepID=UPI000FCBFF91|nr:MULTISPECIES: ABC transporter ATP-binding protein [unclassified Mesorhizobium]RUX52560.1 ABC transporter ATP-binding protein [Mesorhizobium sp. M4A.F.Ca.ET.050.02.1.1]RWB73248.1 MAG: ABC transporter ATP-binding protein [Mesorhizobium sp.]RWB90832.1 MAG: ABC transporter ATP-binding protein [Mesorhizobium sp.]TGS64071.1 ABC transporter ATP-binding protein [Mesorhizobium sp. M3A.F.Ca.ET.201.01.1.1]TGS85795.1 ABC transporter ATP-binding protein [Mesorhizobium sp. M3A.F.Ca.ET.175.01.1.1]